jgi:RNA polymerase sigma-70 factor (ECF subfamily)
VTYDDHLIAAAKRGDSDAWRELYRAHAGRLVVWLQRRSSGAAADAATGPDDISNEAWLTAARKIESFHGTSDEFAGWLFGIARKVSANVNRTHERRQTAPLALVPDAPVAGHEGAITEQAWLDDALAQLSPRERDVITCTDVVGLDVAGTSEALGMTAVTVRVTRHRALKRLRAILGAPVTVA